MSGIFAPSWRQDRRGRSVGGMRGERSMVEKVQEPIEVLSRFVEGKIQPVRFRWRGRVFTITRVTSAWMRREGEQREHFFSVGVGTREQYELCYCPQTSLWTLETVHAEA
ncbi:MAG: hypothetical protein U0167_09370 [bacterium]